MSNHFYYDYPFIMSNLTKSEYSFIMGSLLLRVTSFIMSPSLLCYITCSYSPSPVLVPTIHSSVKKTTTHRCSFTRATVQTPAKRTDA